MLKKMFTKKPGGLIRFYGLTDWWLSLTEEEQSKVKHYGSLGIGGNPKKIDTWEISSTGSSQNFLSTIGLNASLKKDYSFAEKVLLHSLTVPDSNSKDIHFVYNHLIDLYYKQRSERLDGISLCVEYCLKDIKDIKRFLTAWRNEYAHHGISKSEVVIPRIPSFERLAIIYGKEERYDEAIELCKKAISLGLHDGTKGDYAGRISRLEKQRDRQSVK